MNLINLDFCNSNLLMEDDERNANFLFNLL